MPKWETYKVGKTRYGKGVYGIVPSSNEFEVDAHTIVTEDDGVDGIFYLTMPGFYLNSYQMLVPDTAQYRIPVDPPLNLLITTPGLAFSRDATTGLGRSVHRHSLFPSVEKAVHLDVYVAGSIAAKFTDGTEVDTPGAGPFNTDKKFSLYNRLAHKYASFSAQDAKLTIDGGFYSTEFGEPVYRITAGKDIRVTESDNPHQYSIAYIGDEFYGITISESDGAPAIRNVNELKFFSTDFYIEQPTGTDAATVNLRHRLTRVNDSGGTVNVTGSIRSHSADATLNIGEPLNRFDEIFCRKVIARVGTASAAANGPTSGGSQFGSVSQAAGNRAELSTGSLAARGSFAIGRVSAVGGTGNTARTSATAFGSFAGGYAKLFDPSNPQDTYITASGNASFAFGYSNAYYGSAAILATGKGSLAFGSTTGQNNSQGTITASNNGALAMGCIYSYSTSSYISATGRGAFAVGYANNSSIIASAPGCMQLGAGTNSTSHSLQVGNAAVRLLSSGEINFNGPLNHDGTTAGFFSKTPVTQRPDCFYLRVPFTATTDASLAQISGTGDDTNVNNNFAELAAKVNRIRDALRALGLMAGG